MFKTDAFSTDHFHIVLAFHALGLLILKRNLQVFLQHSWLCLTLQYSFCELGTETTKEALLCSFSVNSHIGYECNKRTFLTVSLFSALHTLTVQNNLHWFWNSIDFKISLILKQLWQVSAFAKEHIVFIHTSERISGASLRLSSQLEWERRCNLISQK